MDSKWLRNSFVYLILLVAVVALFFTAFPQSGSGGTQQISISEVAAGVKDGSIKQIQVSDDSLQITYADKHKATSRKDTSGTLADFGYTPQKSTKSTVAVKAVAVEKNLNTRVVHHVMGKKQLAKLTGPAPVVAPGASAATTTKA